MAHASDPLGAEAAMLAICQRNESKAGQLALWEQAGPAADAGENDTQGLPYIDDVLVNIPEGKIPIYM